MQDGPELLRRELDGIERELIETEKIETYNVETGVDVTKFGMPLGIISITNLKVDNVSNHISGNVVVRISILPKGSGPAPKELGPVEATNKQLVFNQLLQFAPIRTIHAELVLTFMHNSEIIGRTSVDLIELESQEFMTLTRPLFRQDDMMTYQTDLTATIVVRFQYSKILRLMRKIWELREGIRDLTGSYPQPIDTDPTYESINPRNVIGKLEITEEELKQAQRTYIYDPRTGVDETRYGLPLGCINIYDPLIVDNISNDDKEYFLMVSVIPSRPAPKFLSRTSVNRETGELTFNSSDRSGLQLAPILTIHAELVIQLRQGTAPVNYRKTDDLEGVVIGEVRVNLAQLKHQKQETFDHKPLIQPGQGVVPPPTISFKMRFQYSKILRLSLEIWNLRRRIMQLTGQYPPSTLGNDLPDMIHELQVIDTQSRRDELYAEIMEQQIIRHGVKSPGVDPDHDHLASLLFLLLF